MVSAPGQREYQVSGLFEREIKKEGLEIRRAEQGGVLSSCWPRNSWKLLAGGQSSWNPKLAYNVRERVCC